MKKAFSYFISVVWLCAMLAACSGGGGGGSSDNSGNNGTYSISGTVTANGSALQGVTIALSGVSSANATTDTSGKYTFTGLANGAYTVTPSMTNYTFNPANIAITVADANVTGQDFSPAPVKYSGFDFQLKTGDFWEYGWDYNHSTNSYGSGSSDSSKSRFRITLGDPVTVNGVAFYEMLLSGNMDSYGLNGKYLAVSGNQIITLAADKTTQTVIFDANKGAWPGSGFFVSFSAKNLVEATLSKIKNNYIDQAAYVVSQSNNTNNCEYFPGVGSICGGNVDTSVTSSEYYIAGVGPVGYYFFSSYSDWSSGGGFASNLSKNIGLIASSLRGDTVDYVLEVEPNNTIDKATPITLPAKVMGDNTNEGVTTAVSTTPVSLVPEVEPNEFASSTTQFQIVTVPSYITGNVLVGDPYTAVSGLPSKNGSTNPSFQDWYQVTLATPMTLNVELDFPNTSADLDMYLFSIASTTASDTTVNTLASSVSNNITTGVYTEKMSKALAAGTYYVAINAQTTPSRANYTLKILNNASVLNICDWFSFTLASPGQVTITVTGGPSFVLTDNTGASTLASGNATGTTIALAAGSYLIGVNDSGAYTLEVTSP